MDDEEQEEAIIEKEDPPQQQPQQQQPQTQRRNDFDIDWWLYNSGLTTEGGLGLEDRVLLGQLYSNASSVFEWGLGESTFLANHLGVPRYAGIDSDPVWVDQARGKVSKHYRFYFADLGKTGEWGFPHDPNLAKNVLNYQVSPLLVEQEPFDVYFSDGRYRLGCALAAFLHASATGGDPRQTTVLIHDCVDQPGVGGHNISGNLDRNVYKKADHLLDMVAHSGEKLCVYKRKPNTTDQDLSELWLRYATNAV